MSNLLIALMILIYAFQAAFANLYAKNYPGKKAYSPLVYSVIYGLLVAFGTFVYARFACHPTPETLIYGIVNGADLVLYNAMIIRASTLGPFSVTMMFSLSGGILIPTLWSVLHDGDRLTPLQIAGICLMFAAFFLLNAEDKKEGSDGKLSLKFLLTATLLGCANGLYGILMNAAEKRANGTQNSEMILVTYAVSAIFAFVVLAAKAGKETFPAFRLNARSAVFAVSASVCACAAVSLLMFVLSLVSPAVLYTLNNGGVLVISALWSALILREKLGRKKLIGLILAVAAIVALSYTAPEPEPAPSETAETVQTVPDAENP